MIIQNFKKVCLNIPALITMLIAAGLIGYLFYILKNGQLVIGNLGYSFYITELIFEIIISILFGIFAGIMMYKIRYFSKPHKKHLGVGGAASFFGVLVGGCPACSITLASYLGLASIVSLLPYNGFELKIVSIGMLLYVNYDLLRSLEVCQIQKKR